MEAVGWVREEKRRGLLMWGRGRKFLVINWEETNNPWSTPRVIYIVRYLRWRGKFARTLPSVFMKNVSASGEGGGVHVNLPLFVKFQVTFFQTTKRFSQKEQNNSWCFISTKKFFSLICQ